ncbi:MAG: AMP-binding protein, partial [Acidobacteriota bacterium]
MVSTLPQLLANTIKSFVKDDLMLKKKDGAYVPISTGEFGDTIRELCLGLNSLGFRAGDKLCLLSENRPEWVMTDSATLCAGGLTVPIYTTLVPDQIQYIIDDSDATIVVVSNADHWKKIEAIRGQLGKVRHILMIDGPAPAGALSFEAVREKGRALATAKPGLFNELVARVKPGDEAAQIYT